MSSFYFCSYEAIALMILIRLPFIFHRMNTISVESGGDADEEKPSKKLNTKRIRKKIEK